MEAYDYVLGMIMDIMFTIEQKSQMKNKDYEEAMKYIENISLEKKNTDFNTITIKQEYHEALKTISLLKIKLEDSEKSIALVRQENNNLHNKLKSISVDSAEKEMSFLRQI